MNIQRPALMLLLSAVGLNLTGCLGGDADVPDPAQAGKVVAVRTVSVVHTNLALPVRAAGILALKETVKLSFKIGGIVAALNVEEGQAVEEGQILAQLDLSEVRAQVDKAESAFQKASRDLERIRNLFTDEVATLELMQNAQTGLEIAGSDLKVARFNLQHATILAPSRGKILKRYAETGELVAPGFPIFVFASTEKNWIIRFGAIDRDVIRLSPGDPAEVSFDVFPDKVFSAAVSEIAETADPMTGTFEVELSLDGEYPKRPVSGFIAKIKVRPTLTESVALIPIVCLVDGDRNEGYVYTIDESSSVAVRLAVRVGHIIDDFVVVSAGLDGTAHVVSTGAAYLEDGVRVNVVGSDPPPRRE